ncbi:hypothetical protein [Aquimarina sp. RZ0]|uniref:hypothetical protein n=1 Tax=Aquimarina sp. RZ0 TaxID=2607730 RepID=UPI0011F0D02B|nr:hypothetical protein [Aquimarina sp. RZ0]KAA1240377.1 hypothetical protein F0000_26950 [Aquimarina sp. RZ0]
MQLQTDNTDQLIYENEILEFTVLGGIRLEGLDRMRITVKVQLQKSSRPPVRHNLDLYNDTQLEKFIRKCAEKLEIGTSVIAASLSELTEELEKYRLSRIKESEENLKPKIKQLNIAEKETAELFLKEENLLVKTNKLIGESGVIGEETNRLLMYLIFTSRKRQQPLHVISLGSSGTGKTHLQSSVGELMPEEERVSITTLSENAFYYFGKQELKHKVILIEDLDGAENALYPLRELQTKKRIVKTIASKNHKGETQTKYLVVEGPVCVAGCTTKEHIYEDNANRSFLLYLDESPAQDEKIMQYQRGISAGQINHYEETEVQEFLQNVQRILKPIKIINPYAKYLSLPLAVFKPRRTNNHYLQFIEAITFYYQYQREQNVDKKTGEIYIETTLEDIENANMLLKEVLLRKSDELTGSCRNYLENLKEYLKTNKKKQYTNREIRKALRINPSNQKRYNLQLITGYYIKKVKGKKATGYHYEVVSTTEYNQLQDQINSVLDKALEKLKKKK